MKAKPRKKRKFRANQIVKDAAGNFTPRRIGSYTSKSFRDENWALVNLPDDCGFILESQR